MKFRLFSDIHQNYLYYYDQEYWQPPACPEDHATVAIIAGDYWNWGSTRNPKKLFERLSRQFKDVVYVLGNHEHYGCDISFTYTLANDVISEFDNIHLLENRTIWIEDVAIFGCSLWTDCNNEDPISMEMIRRGMSDYSDITIDAGQRKFRPSDSVALHKQSLMEMKAFLDSQRSAGALHKTIVVTHHPMTYNAVHSRFIGSGINGGWVSDLDEFIGLYGPAVICSGHVHNAFNFKIGNTNYHINPRGYTPAGEISGFDEHFSFEL